MASQTCFSVILELCDGGIHTRAKKKAGDRRQVGEEPYPTRGTQNFIHGKRDEVAWNDLLIRKIHPSPSIGEERPVKIDGCTGSLSPGAWAPRRLVWKGINEVICSPIIESWQRLPPPRWYLACPGHELLGGGSKGKRATITPRGR